MSLPYIIAAATILISTLTFWAANLNNKKKANFISAIIIVLVCVSAYSGCDMQVDQNSDNVKLSDSISILLSENRKLNQIANGLIEDFAKTKANLDTLITSISIKGFKVDSNFHVNKTNNYYDAKYNKGVQSFGQKGGQTADDITNNY